ncbi:MAG: TolC family protein [Deltaproteobacteria bacterium]|nr:TolC family protein [Deltaproteobacteria bacterium]
MSGPKRVSVPRRDLSVLLVLLLTSAASSAAVAAAETAAAGAIETVDFPTAVARALRNNPGLSAAVFDRAVAASDAFAARGYLLPALTFEEKFVRTNVPAEAFAFKMNQERLSASDFANVDNFNKPPPINDSITSITLSQPLFAPKAWLGYRMAGRESDARGLDLLRKKEETVHRVVAAYLDVLTAKEYLGVAEKSLEDAREHLRVAETLEKAGLGLASDVLRAKVFLAQAESAKVTAEARHALARNGLALAMGERGGTSVDAAAPLPPFPAGGTLEERIAGATSVRADLKAFSLRVANAGSNVDLQKSDYLPAVGLTGAYQVDAGDGVLSPDNHTWKVGVGLSWNLFDGLRREAAVAKAKAEGGRAREYFRGARNEAAFEVTQAHLAVEEAERRAEIARAAAASAEEGLRLIKARYENQLARMVDLLDAQSALNAARADRVRAGNDLLRARADLEYATGTLLSWSAGEAPPGKAEKAEKGR